jgi:hypothetical protein
MRFYETGRTESFEAGVELALRAMLASPKFVLRVERDPAAAIAAAATGSVTSTSPRDCRSSCGAASPIASCSMWRRAGRLQEPAVLTAQVRRMLADPKPTR